jgi:hypothetical protein
MKNIFKLLFLSLFLFSCNEEDVKHDMADYTKGGYAKFQTEVKTIDYNGGNGALTFTALDANSNAASYSIYKISANISGIPLPAENVTDIVYTSFPAQVSIPLNQLAGYFGLTGADLTYGDSFRIFARVTTTDGRVFNGEIPPTAPGAVPNGNVTTGDLLNSSFGYNQAMQFPVTIACASLDVSQLLGTYKVEFDEFEEYEYRVPATHTVQCVAGPTANSVKFINFSNIGTDLVVTLDPATQSATSPRTQIYNSFYTYGACFAAGNSGLVFSCIGTIDLKMSYTVGIGSFTGAWSLKFVKQ